MGSNSTCPSASSDSWYPSMPDEASTEEGDKWINPAATLPDPAPNLHCVSTGIRFDCGECTSSPCPGHRVQFDLPLLAPNIHSSSYNRHLPFYFGAMSTVASQ